MAPIRLCLGVLTPSANTALEPLTQAIITTVNASQQTHKISVHFSRFSVTSISLADSSSFGIEPILAAAKLLADAKVDMIGWCGTSAGWLGFDSDVKLCQEIEKATGIKATTSVLSLNKALELCGAKSLGLVTPHTHDIQTKIRETYGTLGYDIRDDMSKCLNLEGGDFSAIGEEALDKMVDSVVTLGKVNVVTTFCTNLIAAQRVAFWEDKYKILAFDTVTTVVWGMLRECGMSVTKIAGWGRIFEL
jgi:maleate isomerase